MSKLRIFVDFFVSDEDLIYLREQTAGHELIFATNPARSVLHKADPDPRMSSADIAFGQPDIEAIRDAKSLRWIHISSSGITRYDNPEFRALMAERGVTVTNSAGVFSEACATQAMSFILANARRLPVSLATRTANGTPEWITLRDSFTSLRGQTFLIMGYGAIGKCIAKFLEPYGARVLAYRRTPRGDEGIEVITDDRLSEVLARETDHVINILPDSPATRGYFNAERIAAMKPGVVFYNIGRGTTVDQLALADALHSGHIAAAWLDVTDPEPLADGHTLRLAPNCYITPHVAGGHSNEARSMLIHFVENLRRFERGEKLADRVM